MVEEAVDFPSWVTIEQFSNIDNTAEPDLAIGMMLVVVSQYYQRAYRVLIVTDEP